jgi:hypothetical protein
MALFLQHKLQDLSRCFQVARGQHKTHSSIIILKTVKLEALQVKCIEDKMCLSFPHVPPQQWLRS